MTVSDLDRWFREYLQPERFASGDPSMNGVQVGNDGADVTTVAFAVDACAETIERASRAGAGMLFVHHGLFWGEPIAVSGAHYRRVKALLDGNVALYASHLPLDAHPETGNNSGIAKALGLGPLEPFGEWHGLDIGWKGAFPEPVTLDEAIARLFPDGRESLRVLPFGPKDIRTCAIVSGGGADEVTQAIEQGLDLFVTGEIGHEQYHEALENRISVIAGGHYRTETFGIRLTAARLANETGINVVLLDVPTGL